MTLGGQCFCGSVKVCFANDDIFTFKIKFKNIYFIKLVYIEE